MKHPGPHDGTHPGCFGCKVKHIQIGASALPTRSNGVPPRRPDPAWERGVAGEQRPGGFVPYLDNKFAPIGVKQMQDKRGIYEKIRKDQLTRPTPLPD